MYAAALVFHGLSTWSQMEDTGCVVKTTGQVQSPKRPVRTEWFARATGMTPDGLTAEMRRRVGDYERRRRKKRGAF